MSRPPRGPYRSRVSKRALMIQPGTGLSSQERPLAAAARCTFDTRNLLRSSAMVLCSLSTCTDIQVVPGAAALKRTSMSRICPVTLDPRRTAELAAEESPKKTPHSPTPPRAAAVAA